MRRQGLHRAYSVRVGLYMSSVEPVLLPVSLVVLGEGLGSVKAFGLSIVTDCE